MNIPQPTHGQCFALSIQSHTLRAPMNNPQLHSEQNM